jgi:hypothetical protein
MVWANILESEKYDPRPKESWSFMNSLRLPEIKSMYTVRRGVKTTVLQVPESPLSNSPLENISVREVLLASWASRFTMETTCRLCSGSSMGIIY